MNLNPSNQLSLFGLHNDFQNFSNLLSINLWMETSSALKDRETWSDMCLLGVRLVERYVPNYEQICLEPPRNRLVAAVVAKEAVGIIPPVPLRKMSTTQVTIISPVVLLPRIDPSWQRWYVIREPLVRIGAIIDCSYPLGPLGLMARLVRIRPRRVVRALLMPKLKSFWCDVLAKAQANFYPARGKVKADLSKSSFKAVVTARSPLNPRGFPRLGRWWGELLAASRGKQSCVPPTTAVS